MNSVREQPREEHRVPPNTPEAPVAALGKLSEALAVVEEARGNLYRFHRLTGRSDLALGEAANLFKEAGHNEIARELQDNLVGRNVLGGRWAFRIMEEYDDGYHNDFKSVEQKIRAQLLQGRRDLFEARMKQDLRTRDRRHHEATPPEEPW